MPDDHLTHLIDYRMTLRDLTIRADSLVESALSSEAENLVRSGLDAKTHALVQLAAMVSLGAATPSYREAVEAARAAGAAPVEIAGTLVAIITSTGVPRVVAAAPAVSLALGYDVHAALEEPHDCDVT